ncbi:AraC family transcriptional regulator [Pseudactinotalea sp. Z1739]|uniref:AraC family transcriptional regulator n=1 Tax=Pseudactinotalea sp. Z1739 TaxID=3413028 RepID=UPI003C7ECC35
MGLEDPRQPPAAHAGRQGAVLWPKAGARVFDTGRLSVPAPLDQVVAYYWWVTWRHEEPAPFRQQVLSHPVTHLTVEAAEGGILHHRTVPAALVHGLVTKVFTVDLPVAGRVAGIAFHPGGLAALLDRDVRDLTDAVVGAEEVFGPAVAGFTAQVLEADDDEARRDIAGTFLSTYWAHRAEQVRADSGYPVVRAAVELMREREHVTLAPIAEHVHVSVRTLQRLFTRYVGASPLWVLRRHRLQDAVAALDAGAGEDLSALAASLGFADHAHFTRAFTQVIGVPPSRYRAAQR